jgi:hypothetical protein
MEGDFFSLTQPKQEKIRVEEAGFQIIYLVQSTG